MLINRAVSDQAPGPPDFFAEKKTAIDAPPEPEPLAIISVVREQVPEVFNLL